MQDHPWKDREEYWLLFWKPQMETFPRSLCNLSPWQGHLANTCHKASSNPKWRWGSA